MSTNKIFANVLALYCSHAAPSGELTLFSALGGVWLNHLAVDDSDNLCLPVGCDESTMVVAVVVHAAQIRFHRQEERELRRRRIPILLSRWIVDCAASGCRLPMRFPYTVFDPLVFDGMHFTTTGLTPSARDNVIATVRFFGGKYTADLTTDCDVIIAEGGAARVRGLVHTGTEISRKLQVALIRNMNIGSLAWVRDCVARAQLLPLQRAESSALSVAIDLTASVDRNLETTQGHLVPAADDTVVVALGESEQSKRGRSLDDAFNSVSQT